MELGQIRIGSCAAPNLSRIVLSHFSAELTCVSVFFVCKHCRHGCPCDRPDSLRFDRPDEWLLSPDPQPHGRGRMVVQLPAELHAVGRAKCERREEEWMVSGIAHCGKWAGRSEEGDSSGTAARSSHPACIFLF